MAWEHCLLITSSKGFCHLCWPWRTWKKASLNYHSLIQRKWIFPMKKFVSRTNKHTHIKRVTGVNRILWGVGLVCYFRWILHQEPSMASIRLWYINIKNGQMEILIEVCSLCVLQTRKSPEMQGLVREILPSADVHRISSWIWTQKTIRDEHWELSDDSILNNANQVRH